MNENEKGKLGSFLRADIEELKIGRTVLFYVDNKETIEESIKDLKKKYKTEQLFALVPSTYENMDSLLKAGVNGLAVRTISCQRLIRAIKWFEKHHSYLDNKLTPKFIELYMREKERINEMELPEKPVQYKGFEINKEVALEYLTERECDIFELVSEGLTRKKIASELYLSENTVRNYIYKIFEKLHIKQKVNCLRRGLELGILTPIKK